ncbi:hypothetical protein NUU61_009500 [Penicillium alfredii]|uniref:Zn(2)-C6 fungal-type domain-containing protein n=1 Tax=Penicillium alfredii TaxID=1506179 RepID=A0A9W9ENA2_9EURO|nr:uncharacterized protein NUU61_009500 [Penicillium alfredii]KAJ5084921.1 hypothetical protein NUU61_009500 [Penicillium alfredii]
MAGHTSTSRRLTRCRTGCMRCRIRRRKCKPSSTRCPMCTADSTTGDEGKPSCRNCIDRNFQCQYGPQLTFLTKNAQSVQPSEVGSSSGTYGAIRFVPEEPRKDRHEILQEPEEASPSVADLAQQSSQEVSGPSANNPDDVDDGTVLPMWSPDERLSQALDAPLPATTFSDKDESAVAGLLALGTSMNESMGTDLNLPDWAISPPSRPAPYAPETPQSYSNSHRTPISQSLSQPIPLPCQDSATGIQELLRHYRYEVAPWLDICDLGHSFGIHGLQLAMASQRCWVSILELAETSFNQLHPRTPHPGITKEYAYQEHLDLQQGVTAVALLHALDEVKTCISNVPRAWSPERQPNRELLNVLGAHVAGRDLNSGIYSLFVRLDLGAALVSDTNMNVPLPLSLLHSRGVNLADDPFGTTFYYAQRPLWFCARALQFIHTEDGLPECPPLKTWIQLVDELDHWYRDRPPGFQPMLELEAGDHLGGPEQSFPVVLFANGAGVFGNQLYHTAMLLLLHSRPRTARLSDFQTAAMSPLWHAQRICGIALHNDRRECWDPCLLASFITAARRMTHEFQQVEILRGFQRILTVTGWDARECLESLRSEWCLHDET